MSDDGLQRDNYMKGALWASVAFSGGALALGSLPFATIGLGGIFASVGEWMHYRKYTYPIEGSFGSPAGTYWQHVRVPHKGGDALIWIGAFFGILGTIGLISDMFFQG